MMIERMEALDKFINEVDFDQLWDGFSKTKYSLYDEKNFCLDGKIGVTDERFMGNTAIKIDNEYVAIWDMRTDHGFRSDEYRQKR